jgi:hypothetical protein
MSDHYCCKRCGLRYDDCRCQSLAERKSILERGIKPIQPKFKARITNEGSQNLVLLLIQENGAQTHMYIEPGKDKCIDPKQYKECSIFPLYPTGVF